MMSEHDMFGNQDSASAESEQGVVGLDAPQSEAQLAEERKALAEQQAQAQRELQILDDAVTDAEDALVAHLAKRANIDLLEQACQPLQKLQELGAADLFWGPGAPGADDTLADATERIEGYYLELESLEKQHQVALARIEGQREVLGTNLN